MYIRPFVLSLTILAAAFAQEPTTEKHPYDIANEAIQARNEANRQLFKDNPDVLVLDGIVADRKAKTVQLLACSTGVGATDAVEFFVAPMNSGKDYESLAITWAKPSAVHRALEFIGLKPGHPVNFDANHHWARGPRVVMTFRWDDQAVRAEDMVLETETQTSLPRTGLIFAGSFTHTDENGKTSYAADEVDSKALAPDYNDPVAVLDLPRRLSQSAVYGFQRPNPKYALKMGQQLVIALEPAAGDEAIAARDVTVEVATENGATRYALRDSDHPPVTCETLPHLVTALAKLADGKTDLFTAARIDPSIPVNDARKLYAVLMSLEQDRGVKLEPPAKTELFHRAFFPDEEWRRRENRLGEPWELFLTRDGANIKARLERQVEDYEPDAKQKTRLQEFEPRTPAEFVDLINRNPSQWSKAIFIYPPDDLTYGQLMDWARPALASYPRIFVFPPIKSQP